MAEKIYLTEKEAAEELKVSVATFQRLNVPYRIMKTPMSVKRPIRRYYWPDLNEWAKRQEQCQAFQSKENDEPESKTGSTPPSSDSDGTVLSFQEALARHPSAKPASEQKRLPATSKSTNSLSATRSTSQ